MSNTGHERWMELALEQASEALKQGEFPVGCVLVAGGEVVGSGARYKSAGIDVNELDHAEIMALRNWLQRGRQGAGGCITAYVTLEPCFMCLGALMINDIGRIVFAYEDVMGGACGTDFSRPLTAGHERMAEGHMPCNTGGHIYLKYGSTLSDSRIIGGVMRKESLELFYEFFSNDSNEYLKDTYLAHYTIQQGRRL